MNFLLQSSALGGTAIVLRLAFAMGLSIFVALVYHRTYVGYGRPSQFSLVLVLIAMTIAGIIMAIGENLALSLGLVGALSIVRFRSAVKENRDLAYLFWAIALGLVCGAGNFLLAIILLFSVGGVVLLMEKFDFFRVGSKKYILIVSQKSGPTAAEANSLSDILPSGFVLKSSSYNEKMGSEESTFLVELGSSSIIDAFKRCLIKDPRIQGFQLLTPEDSVIG